MPNPTTPPPAPGTTHSPGPWRISGQSETGRYITVKAANGRTVARVPFNPENTPLPECTDARDALAISLLPELLAALEDMVNLVDDCFEGGAELDADDADIDLRIKKSVALINKARGQ